MVPARFIPILMLNPMASVILAYRDILYFGVIPQFSTLIGAVLMGFFVLIIGYLVFSKLQRNFAEEL